MIFIGTAGLPLSCKRNGIVKCLEYIKSIGLNAMEIEFVHGVNMSSSLALRVRKKAEELGIRLSVHAPYYINLCNEEKYESSKQRILLSCKRANDLGAKIVVFHPGYYGDLSEVDAFDTIYYACSELTEEIEKQNLDVILGMETSGKKYQFGSLDEVIDMARMVKNCVPVIDFAHIYARNGGKIDYDEVFRKLKILHLDHYHSHFSGISFDSKGEKMHLPIGSGPEFEPLARYIVEKKINITIISESPLLEKDALKMKQILERLGAFK